MSVSANKMAAEEENQEPQNHSPEENDSQNELAAPCWSVVSFEAVAVSGLSYGEAVKWMENLRRQKVSGLCIITDKAAARTSK